MSSFLTSLSEKFHSQNPNEAIDFVRDYFNQSAKPFQDLLDCLSQLSESDTNTDLINTLLQVFLQWKNQLKKPLPSSKFDETIINRMILQTLPIESLDNFIEIFHISKEYLLNLFRSSLSTPTNGNLYKRTVQLIVKLNYQLDIPDNELLLPLILSSKDYLIDVYLNKTPQYEEYLLKLLDHLFDNRGNTLREILTNEYQMKNVSVNKRTLSKFVVRYWNLYGNEQNEKYPNLAILQYKRTLGYLINMKYNGLNEEKAMSDECWNELVGVRRREVLDSF